MSLDRGSRECSRPWRGKQGRDVGCGWCRWGPGGSAPAMCPGSRAHHTEEGMDCRRVSFSWSPSWLGSRVLNPEVCDNRTRSGCPKRPVDISLGNQLPDPLVQGQGRSSCSSVRGWPPWERQPSPGGRLLSHCSPCPGVSSVGSSPEDWTV